MTTYSVTPSINMVDICTLFEQQLHYKFMAFTRNQMQGSSSIKIQKILMYTFVQHFFFIQSKWNKFILV